MRKIAAAACLGLAALSLSACATGLPTQVTRFQAMPAPAGQSFAVVAADPARANGLEFQTYADMVAAAMTAKGYTRAASPAQATMLVSLGYGVDEGQTQYVRDPFYDPYNDPFYGRGTMYRRPVVYGNRVYYPRWGSPRGASPYYYGWADPALCGYDCAGVERQTVYQSHLDIDIRRQADGKPLFDGHALARSRTDRLNRLVPSLVTAMFDKFPGKSGETVKITVADPKGR